MESGSINFALAKLSDVRVERERERERERVEMAGGNRGWGCEYVMVGFWREKM